MALDASNVIMSQANEAPGQISEYQLRNSDNTQTTSSGDSSADWPMYGHDPQHTGRSPFTGPNIPAQKWELYLGLSVSSPPAIGSDGTIYLNTYNYLYAFNPNGSEKWEYITGTHGSSSPAIGSDGTVYVGAGDGLYAINPDGSSKWKFQTNGSVNSTTIAFDGTIYIGSNDKKLYAINPDGSKKWEFVTGGIVYSSPAIGADGTIYVGSYDNYKLYAINPDGSKKWEFITGGLVPASPSIGDDGTIYIGSLDNKLYAMNPDGTKKWEFVTNGQIHASAAIGNDGTIYIGSGDDNLYAINPDGTKIWNFPTASPVSSATIGNDGTIYVTSGRLYAIHPDGSKKWEFIPSSSLNFPPVIDSNGTMYVCSSFGDLYAVDSANSSFSVTINQAENQADPTLKSPVKFTAVFSEPVTDFARRDIALSGTAGATTAVISNPSGDHMTYTIEVSGMVNDGTVIANIYANYVKDATGRIRYASTSIDNTVTYLPEPTVTVNQAEGQIDPTGSSPIRFKAVFRDPVMDFTNGDVTISGTAGATTASVSNPSGDHMTYNIEVSGIPRSGSVWVSIQPDIAHNAAGFPNHASTSTDNSVFYDIGGPVTGRGDWWMFGHDPQHTGLSSFTGPDTPSIRWKYITQQATSSPAMDSNGVIYLSSFNNLVAINPNGSKKWMFAAGDYLEATPAIGSDGTIYVGSSDKKLYAINPDGSKKWEFVTGNAIDSSPAIATDGTIYVGSSGYLYAINPDGSEKWVFPVGNSVPTYPAVAKDGTIYIGSSGYLYAINPNGTSKWKYGTGYYGFTTPAISSDGTIYVGSSIYLYAINPNGTKKWGFTLKGNTSSTPSIGPDGTIYIGSYDYNLYAINPNGSKKWVFATGNYVYSTPAIDTNGTIYLGMNNNNLCAINPNGSKKWALELGLYMYESSPAIGSNGTIYIGSGDGSFYAIGGIPVSINQAADQSDPTNASPVKFTVVFGESVTDFTAKDVILSGTAGATTAVISNPSGDNTTYLVEVTGMKSNGTVIATISADAAHNADGKTSNASTSTDNTVVYQSPYCFVTVNQAAGQADPASTLPIRFTAVFSEPVLDFEAADVILQAPAGALVTNITNPSGDHMTYTIEVGNLSGSAVIRAFIPAGAAHDSNGYSSHASTSTDNTVTYNIGGLVAGHNEWGMFGYDLRHTHSSPFTGPNSPAKKWEYAIGGYVYSSPAIDWNGTIYVGSMDYKVYAINHDGSTKWEFATDNWVFSSPAIDCDGTVYAVSYNGSLYAINPDGSKKWVVSMGGDPWSSPVIGTNGMIYAGAGNDLYAINPDGTVQWTFVAGDKIYSSPAIQYDGTVYVGSSDNKLYAINPDGSKKWEFETGGQVISSPAVGIDGTIYVGSYDNKLYAINTDGSKKWEFTTGGQVYSSSAVGPDGIVYVGSGDNNLYAINPDGSKKWAFATGNQVNSSPTIGSDGTVYVGSNDNNLYAINPDGSKKWNFDVGGMVYSSPTIGSDGTIYVGPYDNGGKLWAIGSAPPTVTDITPNSALAVNSVNITDLTGTGFISGSTVKLTKSGQSDIAASSISVLSSTKITCNFDLAGKTAGKWNVVVTNSDGQTGTLTDGFTVSEGYTLSSTVRLGDYSGTIKGVPVTIDLIADNGIIVRTEKTTLDEQGKFYIHRVQPGTYRVGIKPSHWLRKVTGPVTISNADVDFVIR